MSGNNFHPNVLQGSTIKPLVALLNITRSKSQKETLNIEINDNVSFLPQFLEHPYQLNGLWNYLEN
jgi:hypothetical protein